MQMRRYANEMPAGPNAVIGRRLTSRVSPANRLSTAEASDHVHRIDSTSIIDCFVFITQLAKQSERVGQIRGTYRNRPNVAGARRWSWNAIGHVPGAEKRKKNSVKPSRTRLNEVKPSPTWYNRRNQRLATGVCRNLILIGQNYWNLPSYWVRSSKTR